MAQYQVTAIWWPDGWEPHGPLDVPNCVQPTGAAADGETMTLERAVATVRGLNRQNMDHPGATWHVVTVAGGTSASGTPHSEVEGAAPSALEVVRPEEGSGRGDCSHCPAHDFPCAAES